jgi:hypothetical protein
MLRSCVAFFLLALCLSCNEKKASLNGAAPVSTKDFFNGFTKLSTPFTVADSNNHSIEDTGIIAYPVFKQFVPDSVLTQLLGNNSIQYQIKPVGKIEKSEEIYLLANFIHNKRTILITFLFDKKYHFLSALELFNNKKDDGYKHSVSITSEPTFLLSKEKITSDNHFLYTKNGYAYNDDVKGFILVVNDSNEDASKVNDIVNPIDTLPQRNKFSGDYAEDKKNFISVRDGKNANDYNFFIHFEKEDATCVGEIKGEMTTTDKNKTIYHETGDPCVIDFIFSSSDVYVKEEGSCGNHRGIKCYYDDTFTKRKSLKFDEKKKSHIKATSSETQ